MKSLSTFPTDELRGTWVGQYNPIRLAFIIAP